MRVLFTHTCNHSYKHVSTDPEPLRFDSWNVFAYYHPSSNGTVIKEFTRQTTSWEVDDEVDCLYNVDMGVYKVTAYSGDGAKLPATNLELLKWDQLCSEASDFTYTKVDGKLYGFGLLFFEEETIPEGHPLWLELEYGV
jgi:hypothetical protein